MTNFIITLFICYLPQVYGRAPVGVGGKTLKHFSIFLIWRTNKYLKIKETLQTNFFWMQDQCQYALKENLMKIEFQFEI